MSDEILAQTDAAPAPASGVSAPETASLSRRARRILSTDTVALSVIDLAAIADAAGPAQAPAVIEHVAPTVATIDEPSPAVIEQAAASVSAASRRARRASSVAGDASPTEALEVDETSASVFELREPAIAPENVTTASVPAASVSSSEPIDEFQAAAKLFSFTGEQPVMRPAAVAEDAHATPASTAHVAPARRAKRGASFRRVATTSFSVGVMGIVGLLAVAMTTPAAAVAAASGTSTVDTTTQQLAGDVQAGGQIQAYVAPSEIKNTQIDRSAGNYQTARLVDLAGTVGISNFSSAVFTNNVNCPIQWPFAVGVPISYGFGMRDGVMHEGVDFTPGDGSHIQAIADGVVRESTDSGGGYGVEVVIDHVIDGQLVSSRYGHMQYGSRQVQVGDHVKVGEYIGRTGDTGHSFGAHTHVEILLGGTTAIDPMPWFRQHATC